MITTGTGTAGKMFMLHILAQEQVKAALYTMEADIGPDTPAYTTLGEASGKGYKPGGVVLRNARVWENNGEACLTWDSPVLPVASISANGFMLYLPQRGNKCIFVGAYNQTFTSEEGPFTISIAADQICLK